MVQEFSEQHWRFSDKTYWTSERNLKKQIRETERYLLSIFSLRSLVKTCRIRTGTFRHDTCGRYLGLEFCNPIKPRTTCIAQPGDQVLRNMGLEKVNWDFSAWWFTIPQANPLPCSIMCSRCLILYDIGA
jgi:hypothetical protein